MRGAAKRVTLEVVGWTLVLAGIAALVLPGPGSTSAAMPATTRNHPTTSRPTRLAAAFMG